ncbi:MAG TPA: hypothetical protein VG308_14830, partial [Stellaceae bacterium]|nr:hypothetical protein [Stellaceae bacterium]
IAAAVVLLSIVIGIVVYFLIPSSSGELIAGLDTISWAKDVPDTAVSKEGSVVSVTTSPGRQAYQIKAAPNLPAGQIVIDYKVNLLAGSISLGILSSDRQKC